MVTKIKKLTDKMRFDLADGKILTSYGDFELKKYQPNLVPGKPTLPAVPGGIFDSKIFGSPYTDRCDCGFTVGKGNTCNKCHSHINTDEELLSAVGLIKSPVYFINSLALPALDSLLAQVFTNWTTRTDFTIDKLYTKFFTFDAKLDSLHMWDLEDIENPDFTELSIEGLIKIFEKHKAHKLENLMQIVQRYILVRPISMRPWSYTYKPWLGTRTLEKHQLNFQYQSILYISTELMNGINLAESSVEDLVYSLATIRLAITKIMDGVTDLINSSKYSSIREGFSVRVPNSGRGVALADPNLNIDEVSLPIGMCYEIFRNQFISWIHLGFKLNEEEITYKIINKDKEMISLFKKFVDEKDLYVMVNRAPTLYKLSQLVFKVTLNEGSSIGYSLMATTPLNLDFDGDTIAVYEVPEHLIHTVQDMIPSKLSRYMKSDQEVIKPKQETLIGLMIASGIGRSEDKSSKIQLRDLDSAEEKFSKGDIASTDLITIGNEVTTYGRAKLSAILGFKLDYQIDDKNISKLMTELKSHPNYVNKAKELQDFGLEVATFESETDLTLENLSKSASTIDKYEANENLSNVEIYGKSLEFVQGVTPLRDSLKGGKKSISSIVSPQMTYDGSSYALTSDSMLGTLSAAEYVNLSVEFRKVQQVKVNSVGESGYLSRQIWTAMSNLVYSDEIKSPTKLLTVIPDSDGYRFANGNKVRVKKGEEVQVDSVIYNPNNVVYENNLYDSMKFRDGHLIGIDFGMQISEGTTQGILKLKHEGGYVLYSNYGLLSAEIDCKVTHDSDYFYINGSKILKSPNFQFVDPNRVEYKKGDLIGINPTLVSPSTNLYLLMKLLRALGSTSVLSKPQTYVNLYSLNSGVVKFDNGKVDIGGKKYVMPDESLCLVYEGQEVEVGTKLFTGALNYSGFVKKYSELGVNVMFKVFENELKSFVNIKSILIEFLFKSIHYIDVMDSGSEAIVFKGIVDAIDPSEDLLTSLTLGYIKKKITDFIASDSTEMGKSNLINIAYQFNGLRLSHLTNEDKKQLTNKSENYEQLQ